MKKNSNKNYQVLDIRYEPNIHTGTEYVVEVIQYGNSAKVKKMLLYAESYVADKNIRAKFDYPIIFTIYTNNPEKFR